jgi:16S rRNA G966 N2-methylase RsmD
VSAGKIVSEDNKLRPEDRAAHDWYRFVLSFPPHLVRSYLDRFDLHSHQRVLDPFCGTGTTLVECKKRGIASVGTERNPIACLASRVKLDWSVDHDDLLAHARGVARIARERLESDGFDDEAELPLFRRSGGRGEATLRDLHSEVGSILLKDSISPLPLHKTLVLLEAIERQRDQRFTDHERLALAKVIVFQASNLQFGPEVGVGPPKPDAAVVAPWLRAVGAIAEDVRHLRANAHVEAIVYETDARRLSGVLPANSVDAVITSPPYPNEKDYTRTTRLESVLLGFIRNKSELRSLKQGLVRSNTRSVYKNDDDDGLVATHAAIQCIAETIERRRIELGKTSGFERMYARVTKLYFGGMSRHLADLRKVLRPGAHLAYVVGDQASYLRVMIRTGQLLADIARSYGYVVEGIDLFRTRLATATKEALREEVVVLRWPGTDQP